MSLTQQDVGPSLNRNRALVLAAALLFGAVVLSTAVYIFQEFYIDECSEVTIATYCRFAYHLTERTIAVLVLVGIFVVGRWDRLLPLRRAIAEQNAVGLGVGLGAIGVTLLAVPVAIWGIDPLGVGLMISTTTWAFAIAFSTFAVASIFAPLAVWGRAIIDSGPVLWGLIFLGLIVPELGDTLFPLWQFDWVKDVTFQSVIGFSNFLGMPVVQGQADYVIGLRDFWIEVGQSCSGIEGFVLITVFLSGYVGLFWKQLLPARVIWILPIGIALSWAFNVFRITLLIWLGLNVSPTLAIEGFHSHAGWLMFSILALLIMAAIHNIAWFRRPETVQKAATAPVQQSELPPFFDDWTVARILPFAVFMCSALLASTFVELPALAYPARALAMIGVLWLLRRPLATIEWRLALPAVVSGAIIGVAWIATSIPDEGGALATALSSMGTGLLVIWIISRMIGTTLLVPVIEELFFRSYLLERFGFGKSLVWTIVALTISTAAFAVLHDRWFAAALAGLIFAWVALRPGGKISDAIVSHMVANGLIALWALVRGAWWVI